VCAFPGVFPFGFDTETQTQTIYCLWVKVRAKTISVR